MAEGTEEGWARGYEQAVEVLFDEALAPTPQERLRLKKERIRLQGLPDYNHVREALDKAAGSLHMSRATAAYYLAMSPHVFQQHVRRSTTHPFAGAKGGATKGEVDAWFAELVKNKHIKKHASPDILRVGRDEVDDRRPYLVDKAGVILADAKITMLPLEDAIYAIDHGGGIRILYFDIALGMPWANPLERKPWAAGRQRILQHRVEVAQRTLVEARRQDLEACLPHAPDARHKPPL